MTQTRVVQAQNDLGFSLLHAVSGKDAFISPFSIAQALGVVYLGARGATAKAFVKSSVVPPVDASGSLPAHRRTCGPASPRPTPTSRSSLQMRCGFAKG